MVYDNGNAEVNLAIANFKANGETYGYVYKLEDTEKRVVIDYPFDISFKLGKLYHITYETTRMKVGLTREESMREPVANKVFDCGYCRLLMVERKVCQDEINNVRFIFKKVKSKNKR